MPNIKWIIVHHSGGTDANPKADSSGYTVKQCDADHKVRFNMKSSLGWYVGYTYFIDKAGVVTQTRKDGEEGAHTVRYNKNSIGICLAGNFDAFQPTAKQVAALKKLLKEKSDAYKIPLENIVPHRKFASKTCFGTLLPDTWAADLIRPVESNKETITEILRLIGEIVKLLKKLV